MLHVLRQLQPSHEVGQALDGLAEQRDEVAPDVAAGAGFLEIVAGDMGKAQDIIEPLELARARRRRLWWHRETPGGLWG